MSRSERAPAVPRACGAGRGRGGVRRASPGTRSSCSRCTRCPSRLRPPGAQPERDFAATCVKCGAVRRGLPLRDAARSPRAATGIPLGTPHFVAREEPCRLCPDIPCAKACPTGSLDRRMRGHQRCAHGARRPRRGELPVVERAALRDLLPRLPAAGQGDHGRPRTRARCRSTRCSSRRSTRTRAPDAGCASAPARPPSPPSASCSRRSCRGASASTSGWTGSPAWRTRRRPHPRPSRCLRRRGPRLPFPPGHPGRTISTPR